MSGLEPLAVFGLACNVMTVISFAHETASLCKNAFETGTADPDLVKTAEGSVKVLDDLEASLKSAPNHLTDNERELLGIARESLAVGRALKSEVDKIARDSGKGKLGASVKVAFMAKWKAKKIEKLEKTAQDHQRVLETRLLMRVCDKSNAISLQQDERFNRIDYNLQLFIQRFAEAQTELKQLLGQEAASVKDRITIATSQSRKVITEHISFESINTRKDLSLALVSLSTDQEQQQIKKFRERFLASLKFETMNERRNQIPQCHEGTFEWILRDNYFSDYESSDGDSSDGDSSDGDSFDGVSAANESPYYYYFNPKVNSYPRLCHHGNKEGRWDCFPCWLESEDKNLYWINGKAGSGKSTLMKFLASNSRTKEFLRVQNEDDILILSHFLWNAGNPMQKSVKGILLNLLHQLLSEREMVIDPVMTKLERKPAKDFPGDWSREELELSILFAFSAVGHPICVFLDGLDEINEDVSPTDLMDLVFKLGSIPKVKVCVSSRPEPIFKRRLESTPHLRVQDLTIVDMQKYVGDKLKPDLDLTKEGSHYLIHKVCSKADGVFLLVALAVKSLLRGLSGGDSFPELSERLDILPNSLQQLYEQMWQRLNEDKISYREDAALYIYLALEFPDKINYKVDYRTISGNLTGWHASSLNIFHITAVVDSSFMEKILEDDTVLSTDYVQEKCNSTSRRLEARTAGLLEVNSTSGVVSFIHRSAAEFFQNTEAGRRVLEHVKLTPAQRIHGLLRAFLGYIRLQLQDEQLARMKFRDTFLNRNGGVECFVILTYLLISGGDIPVDLGLEILVDAKNLYERGLWWYISPSIKWRPDFNGIAASLGLLEITSPLLQSMPDQPAENHWTSTYLSYLLTMTCSSHYTYISQIRKAISQQMSWFLNQDMAWNMPTVIPNFQRQTFCSVTTPAIALMTKILKNPWAGMDIRAAPEVFRKFLLLEGCLDETVLFWLLGYPRGLSSVSLRVPPEYRGTIQIVIEVNVVFLIRFYIHLADGLVHASTPMEGLVDDMRGVNHRSYFKVLGFVRTPLPFEPDRPRTLVKPGTNEDSEYVRSCVEQTTMIDYASDFRYNSSDPGPYLVPGLWESFDEMVSRGIETDMSSLEEDLIRRGFLIREEDVTDWPPKPTATERSHRI